MDLKKLFIGRIGWLSINAVRASLVSRALVTLSVSVSVLANAQILGNLFSPTGLRSLVWGSMTFLIGYLLPFLVAPIEFRTPRSRSIIAMEFSLAANSNFVNDRTALITSLVKRLDENRPWDLPSGLLQLTKTQITTVSPAASLLDAKLKAAQIMDVDLLLRSYDRFLSRVVVSILLGLGTVLMLFPVGTNLLKIL